MARAKQHRRQAAKPRITPISHGQTATSPTAIPRRGWREVLRRIWDSMGADHVSIVAAGVAFFGLLALFPAIGALVAIAGTLLEPSRVEQELGQMLTALPDDAANIVMNQATSVASVGGGLTIGAVIGLLLTLYSASAGMRYLMEGLNIAYEEKEKRSFFKKVLISLALTLGVIFGFIVAIVSVIAIPIVINTLDLGQTLEALLNYVRWPVLAVFAVIGLGMIYRFGPSRAQAKWRWVSAGAVAATVLWIIASIGFSIYVRNFASYNETYGSLGAAIILMMWLWISAFVILMGAELNAELEHQTEVDSTTGAPRPMGERGAVKADTRPRRR